MRAHPSLLVALLRLIDRLPLPADETRRQRGRPVVYSDRLFLKAPVVMIVRRLTNVHLLYTVLHQPTPEMEQLRAAIGGARVPAVPADVRTPPGHAPGRADRPDRRTRALSGQPAQAGAYPHRDPGVTVRRQFYRLRSITCENFNQVLRGLFELHGQVPTKGLDATSRFVLGAVFVYQLALWYRFEHR